jgi:membrane associated rhomboid family serine protease
LPSLSDEEPAGPWRVAGPPPSGPARERLFNAPAPVLLVVGSLLLAYLVQSRFSEPDPMVDALALVPAGLRQGRVWTLLTVVLVHGSWTHAGLNALGALAFGTPVARWLKARDAGARFLAFYALCAILSSLGYALLHWGGTTPLVGASGAISGLMGGSARLLDRPGQLAPFRSRTVIAMTLAWVAVNGLMAFGWIDAGQGAMPIAWEAHLIGYGAGLLLIGPFTPAFRRR